MSQPIDAEHWLPLVAWVSRRMPDHVHRRLGQDDLYQAGVIGLMNAIRLYKPDRGVLFKTYAVHKIRWSMYIAAGLTRQGWEPLPVQLDERTERRLSV